MLSRFTPHRAPRLPSRPAGADRRRWARGQVVYARQDALALARLVGSARAEAMLAAGKPLHVFA
jgi:hypothetical protein